MRNFVVGFTILLAVFVGDASAYPGVSINRKGNGIGIGNIRSDGNIVDGFSLATGTADGSSRSRPPEEKWLDEINGISLSFWPVSKKIRGLSVSVFLQGADVETTGITISGFMAQDKVTGIAIGVGWGFAHEVNGIIIGGTFQGSSQVNGIAIGGITGFLPVMNMNLNGLAIGGLNFAKQVNGVQIGVFNYAEHLNGMQIGVINYAGNNPDGLKWLPVINAHF